MLQRLTRPFAACLLAVLAAAMPARAEEDAPVACPDDAAQVLMQVLSAFSSGQFTDANEPYNYAKGAVNLCGEDGIVLSLAITIEAGLAAALQEANSLAAGEVWQQAYLVAIRQDRAPDDTSVTFGDPGTEQTTYTGAHARQNVDTLMQNHIAPGLVRSIILGQTYSGILTTPQAACPYPGAGGARAVSEAKGLASGLHQSFTGANFDPVFERMDQLRTACSSQYAPIAEEEIQAYIDVSEELADRDYPFTAACVAESGKALLSDYRAALNAGTPPVDDASGNRVKAWDENLKSLTYVACDR